MRSVSLQIGGMSCRHCVARLSGVLAGLDGVEVASVEIGEARIRYDADRVRPEVIQAAIEEAGFTSEGTGSRMEV